MVNTNLLKEMVFFTQIKSWQIELLTLVREEFAEIRNGLATLQDKVFIVSEKGIIKKQIMH